MKPIKTLVIRLTIALIIIVSLAFAWVAGPYLGRLVGISSAPKSHNPMIAGGGLPIGCYCHSKNKAMVKMHDEFGVADCSKCHANTEDTIKPKSDINKAEQVKETAKRKKTEKICRECHQT